MLNSFAPLISKNRRFVAMLQEYKLLEPEDPSLEEEQCSERRSTTVYFSVKLFVPLLTFLLFTSLALNVRLGYQQLQTQRRYSRESPTIYGRTLIALFENHHNTLNNEQLAFSEMFLFRSPETTSTTAKTEALQTKHGIPLCYFQRPDLWPCQMTGSPQKVCLEPSVSLGTSPWVSTCSTASITCIV